MGLRNAVWRLATSDVLMDGPSQAQFACLAALPIEALEAAFFAVKGRGNREDHPDDAAVEGQQRADVLARGRFKSSGQDVALPAFRPSYRTRDALRLH
eukprot:scaffold5039_cov255-Pinguiococcus_pyrenoidosus.AAC.10